MLAGSRPLIGTPPRGGDIQQPPMGFPMAMGPFPVPGPGAFAVQTGASPFPGGSPFPAPGPGTVPGQAGAGGAAPAADRAHAGQQGPTPGMFTFWSGLHRLGFMFRRVCGQASSGWALASGVVLGHLRAGAAAAAVGACADKQVQLQVCLVVFFLRCSLCTL